MTMRRTLITAAIAALALAAAPAATAKEIKKAQVCGPDACAAVDDEQGRAILVNGGPPRQPPTAAPYYEVRITMAEGDEEFPLSNAAVPARHALRGDDGTWMDMPPEMVALINKVAGDQRPFPAADLVGAAPPSESPAQPGAADSSDSPLWPEGVVIALLAIGAAFLVRGLWLRGAARRA
jgi:hypothetical protein